MTVVIGGGFSCSLQLLSMRSGALRRRMKRNGTGAAGDWRVAGRCGRRELEVDSAVGNGTGESGATGTDIVELLETTIVFRGGPNAWSPSSDRAAMCRAGGGGRSDRRVGRSPSPW